MDYSPTTITLSTEDMLEAVRSTAMLANVYLGHWSAEKTDKSMMDEIKVNAGATGNVGRAVKNILAGADGLLKDAQSAYAQVRTTHYNLTLPWIADPHAERKKGPRLLPNMLLEKYLSSMGAAKRAAEAAREKFLDDYPDAIVRAKKSLGRLTPQDYPPVETVRAAFHVSFAWEPIPAGAGFKGLPDSMLAKLSMTLEKRQRAMVEQSQLVMWQEVRDRVTKLAEKLADPSARFQYTTIENVRELVELLPGWNVVGHGAVPELISDIERMLKGIDADAIREDIAVREEVAKKATNVMNKLAQWGF